MTDIAELTVQVLDDRDIVVTMPETGFAVTYRKDGNFPMLVAADMLRDDLGPTRLSFLAQGLAGCLQQGQGARLAEVVAPPGWYASAS